MAANDLPERVVNAMQLSAAALQKAEEQMNEKQAADQRYANGIPLTVEECVKFGAIDNTELERTKLAEWLRTPEGALEVVRTLAQHLPVPQVESTTKTAGARMGQPVDESGFPAQRVKTAFAGGGYVGRRSDAKPESWRKLEEGLGLTL